jgi:SAM-dependent MidA family methyltransferase
VKAAIIESIRVNGVMPFDAYMDRCLYGAGGFFTAGHGSAGSEGDFVTSPEVSSHFGELMCHWVDAAAPMADSPLIEIGAGSGALLASMGPTRRPLYAVERSPAARRSIADRVPDVGVLATMDEIADISHGAVIANELLDNLPFALARRTHDGWMEVGVGTDGEDIVWSDLPPRDDVVTWCNEFFPGVTAGTLVSAQLDATAWVTGVIDRFSALAMCIIDYAASSDELRHRRPDDLVRAYRRHTSPRDWLTRPGSTDITVDVNADAVVAAATQAGADVMVTTQRHFLLDHGAAAIVEGLLAAEREAAGQGRVMDQLAARSQRIDVEALLDPSGLGGFTVFVITKGTGQG